MKFIKLVYVGNLFRTINGIKIIFKFLLSRGENFKLTIYQDTKPRDERVTKIRDFFLKCLAYIVIRNNKHIKIKKYDLENESLPNLKDYDIGLYLGNAELDAKHDTKISAYTQQKLSLSLIHI